MKWYKVQCVICRTILYMGINESEAQKELKNSKHYLKIIEIE